jgi:hypothetical protein
VTRETQLRALADVLRDIVVGGVAAVIAGIVAGGLGGRLAMRFATIVNEDVVGLRTDNGNRIGDITVDGTLALLIFGGLLAGLIGGVLWVIVRPWLPARRRDRILVTTVAAIALGGGFIIDERNPDFLILRNDAAVVAFLLAAVGLFGVLVVILDAALDRRVRRAGADPADYALGALGLTVLGGVLAVPAVVFATFSSQACLCNVLPVPIGVPLVVAGLATLWLWVRRVRGDGGTTPLLTLAGRSGVVAAMAIGGAVLATNVADLPM